MKKLKQPRHNNAILFCPDNKLYKRKLNGVYTGPYTQRIPMINLSSIVSTGKPMIFISGQDPIILN